MSTALPERVPSKPAAPRLTLVPRARAWPVQAALAAIFGAAVLYHWLNSRGHVTPIVFPDELLYSKLAQALAAGDGLTIRGEAVSFPSPLPWRRSPHGYSAPARPHSRPSRPSTRR
jgi:hypothetical protein